MTHTSAAALPADSRYSPSNASQLFVCDSDGNYLAAPDDRVIDAARQVVERFVSKGMKLNTPNRVREFLWLKLAGYDHEVFGAIFMDTQHRVIEFSELFHGTLDSASVYPREVVKAALHHNAGAVIFTHNHPSGEPDPSDADRRITQRLKEALGLIEVRVLDHIVVGGSDSVSFAERGYL
ncbi:DNA repair protein RadC [Halomonas pacifica]|uniref:DNA repair protein RadC n=2 Tax=Halomonas TaxID=2745 RepID=A0A2A2ERG2_9GAMM|nr:MULTISPECIES: DNA repair protein RadC [Halomonas]MDC8802667.1 DNA repair protein RadC [Halomonas pacifica]PAU74952.1 DNA repair protein RadC [Halomonas salipaludis]QTP58220.1 DNA repair protein RadC [Halomonas sulfidivorans]